MDFKFRLTHHSILNRTEFFWNTGSYDQWTLIVPIKGSFCCTMLGRTDQVGCCDMYFYPPGQLFDRYIVQPLQCHYFIFEAGSNEIESSELPFPGKYTPMDQLRFLNTLSALESLHQYPMAESLQIKEHFAQDLWIQSRYENLIVPSPHVCHDSELEEAKQFIENHYSNTINLTELADRFGFSNSQFTRRFTKAFGVPPVEYRIKLQMDKSQELLSQTNMSIKQIALQCGYQNPLYFSSQFKKRFGVSPQQFRLQISCL